MFNISILGDRVDIDSTGVEFRITGAYVSGTSYMVANIEAVGYKWDVTTSYSGTLVNVKLIAPALPYLRNGYNRGVEQGSPARTLAPLAGTVQTIYDPGDSYAITSFVANDKYIYFFSYEPYGGDYGMYVVEYDKDANTSTRLFVTAGYAVADDEHGSIAFIEGRKVLVTSSNDTDWSGIFIADFESNTVVEDTTRDNPFCVRTIVKNNVIWLLCVCYTIDGFEVLYKNYTTNSSWSIQPIVVTYQNFEGHHPFFIGDGMHDWLVWFVGSWTSAPNFYPITRGIAFSIDTFTASQSDWVGVNVVSRLGYIRGAAPAFSNSVAYASCSGIIQSSFTPYHSFQYFVSFNPWTMDISVIYHNDDWTAPPENDTFLLKSPLFSSRQYVFVRNSEDGVVTNLCGMGGDGAIIDALNEHVLMAYVSPSCSCLDDNHNTMITKWYMGLNPPHIHAIGFDGTGDQDINLDASWFSHLGYAIVATDGYTVYLIT